MGGSGERIYSEGSICTDGDESEVPDISVSREREWEGFLVKLEVEKGGTGTDGGEDHRQRLHVDYHFVITRHTLQFCIDANVVDNATGIASDGCQHLDDYATPGGGASESADAEMKAGNWEEQGRGEGRGTVS